MKLHSSLVGLLAAGAFAFPGVSQMGHEAMEEYISKRYAEANANPDGLGDIIGDLTGDIEGLLGSVAEGTLDVKNIRPEPGYEFIAPGPGDSRVSNLLHFQILEDFIDFCYQGPCPGLNLLANYG